MPPGYDGGLLEGGYNIAHSRTNIVWWFGRLFLENHNDPKPPADAVREYTRIYPYVPGGLGTPIAEFLASEAKGWWVILGLYSLLQPFFDKTRRPSEIELVP